MSDINPNDVQTGIEATGYLAALGGLLVTAWGYIFRRQVVAIRELQKEDKNNIKKDDYHRDIDELKEGMERITNIFIDQHKITHDKIDKNQDKIIDLIVGIAKKD